MNFNRFAIIFLIFALLLGFLTGCTEKQTPVIKPGNFFEEGQCEGPVIGTMVRSNVLLSNKFYREGFTDNFEWGTIPGKHEFEIIHPSGSEYRFESADAALSLLENSNKHYGIYHNLITSRDIRIPDWYKLLSQEEKRAFLENHIRTMVSRYKGRIPVYIVVNHPLLWEWKSANDFMGTGWNRVDALSNFFTWAHEEDPKAILILNEGGDSSLETGVIINQSRGQEYVDLINELLDREVPIHGIGLMGHFGLGDGTLPPDEHLINILDLYESTGLPIFITELDVSYDWTRAFANPEDSEYPFNPETEFEGDGMKYENYWEYQAYAYKHAIELFSSHKSVVAIYLWDIVESPESWRTGTGIYFNDGKPKPAYYSIKPLLDDAKGRKLCIT